MIHIGPDIAEVLLDLLGDKEESWYARDGIGVYRITKDPTGDWPVFVDRESSKEDMDLIAQTPALLRTVVQLHKDRDQLQDSLDELNRAYERERQHTAYLEHKIDRLTEALYRIEGGDNPCGDPDQLRRWAFEALGAEIG